MLGHGHTWSIWLWKKWTWKMTKSVIPHYWYFFDHLMTKYFNTCWNTFSHVSNIRYILTFEVQATQEHLYLKTHTNAITITCISMKVNTVSHLCILWRDDNQLPARRRKNSPRWSETKPRVLTKVVINARPFGDMTITQASSTTTSLAKIIVVLRGSVFRTIHSIVMN